VDCSGAFTEHPSSSGRVIVVPSALPRLDPAHALAEVTLPLHLNWSAVDQVFDLRDRRQRARVYEVVLREGGADDVLTYVDGALLLDLWDELVLPRELRAAWQPLIDSALPGVGSEAISRSAEFLDRPDGGG
jgi:hypothetical protein